MHKPKAQNKLNNKVGPKCFILFLKMKKSAQKKFQCSMGVVAQLETLYSFFQKT
jgi:hypothetical protein